MNWDLLIALSGLIIVFASYHVRLNGIEARILKRIDSSIGILEKDISDMKQEILKAKLEVAMNFIRKESFRDFSQSLEARSIRLEGKLDSAIAAIKEQR